VYKGIFFDLDGTIADTELVVIMTMLSFVKTYTPNRKVTLHQLLKISGPPIRDTLKHYFPREDVEQLIPLFAEKAREFYPLYAVAFDGIQDVIASLKTQGIATGIVTSKLRQNALLTLDVIGLDGVFDWIITLDEVSVPKPNPEGIQLCLNKFNLQPSEVLFVGDTVYDYQAGVNARVDTALVTWSLRSFDASIQPTYWIKDYATFFSTIQKPNK
jgi:pyrophosphatase PpaX